MPIIIIHLKAPVDVIHGKKGKLPRLAFGIEIAFGGVEKEFHDETEFHPMVKHLEEFMHLVHPEFTAPFPLHDDRWQLHSRYKFSTPTFSFNTFEELGEKLDLPEDYEHEDGSWKDMLISVPAVRDIEVHFDWPLARYIRTFAIENSGRQRVTCGQFIEAIRSMLMCAEEDVRGFAGEMDVECQTCFEQGIDLY